MTTRKMNWESVFRIPSNAEIQNHNRTSQVRSPYIYGWFILPNETKYTEYMIDFKAGHLPKGTYCCLSNWSMDYSMIEKQYGNLQINPNGIHAYAGFQNIDDGAKVGIMSFWDVFYQDAAGVKRKIRAKRIYPEKATSKEEFTGEGTGAHCSVPYEWEANHWYRMHLRCGTSQVTGNTIVEQWVCDLETGKYTLICSYDVGVKNSSFKGSISVFLENYLPEYSGEVRSMEICNVKYLNADTNQWCMLTEAYIASDSGLPNYEGSYNFGASGNRFWMITSGVGGDWFNNGQGKKMTCLLVNENEKEDVHMVTDNHIFLDNKNCGACKSFTGNVLITVILVDDEESTWTTADMEDFRQVQMAATAKILKATREFHVALKINVQYMRCRVKGTFNQRDFSEWVKSAVKACGFADEKQIIPTLKKRHGVKEAPVLFAVNRKGRSFTVTNTDDNGFEYTVLYRDHGDYRHELLHLFGAKDYYFPVAVRNVAKKYFANSIMMITKNAVVDSLTAYLVGWTERLSADAARFLEETAWLTDEYIDRVLEEEWKTGYGTIRYGDGNYTGDLFEGFPHGKGSIVWDSGDTYDGEWVHGAMQGKGTMTWSNGTSYTGDWENWKMHGHGTCNYANGTKATGRWENDEYKGEW